MAARVHWCYKPAPPARVQTECSSDQEHEFCQQVRISEHIIRRRRFLIRSSDIIVCGTGRSDSKWRVAGRLEWVVKEFIEAVSDHLDGSIRLSNATVDSWKAGRTLPSGHRRLAVFKVFWPHPTVSNRPEIEEFRRALALAAAEQQADKRAHHPRRPAPTGNLWASYPSILSASRLLRSSASVPVCMIRTTRLYYTSCASVLNGCLSWKTKLPH